MSIFSGKKRLFQPIKGLLPVRLQDDEMPDNGAIARAFWSKGGRPRTYLYHITDKATGKEEVARYTE